MGASGAGRHVHQHARRLRSPLYSEGALRRELLAAGFSDVRRYEVDESHDPEFIGVDRRGSRHDATWMRSVTMVREATR